MDSYYEEILKELEALMRKQEYQEVYEILQDEFKMPYIPKESEDRLIALYHEVRGHLQKEPSEKVLDEEQLETMLFGSLEQALQVVTYLKERNIRKYGALIQSYFEKEPHYLIRALLIEALIDQNVQDTFRLQMDGMDIDFIPMYVEMPMEADGALACVQMLREFFENEDPSFLAMCIDTLIKELYFRLPMNLEEDEATPMALAVVEYVFQAHEDLDAFQDFIKKKNLDKSPRIALLLSKHDISK
ncbi:MAG: DUF3196 family protein [Erysipelotrichaceae bacterium]